MSKKIRIIVHSGRFHADELMAVATLELYLGQDVEFELIRSRDPEVWKTADYLVDVGAAYDPSSGKFDHHQAGGAGERDGVPYSSFGAVWKSFGEKLCGSFAVANAIEKRLAYPVDLSDNGIEVYTPVRKGVYPYGIHEIVRAFNSTWKEGDQQTERFIEVVTFFRRLLEREIAYEKDQQEGLAIVSALYHEAVDRRIIVMDGQYPNEALAGCPEPLYVVKPARQSTSWEVECVRDDAHSFKNRKPLPEAWGGKFNDELAMITGVPDATFCHRGRFIAVAKSKEGALKLAQLALAA